MIAFDLDKMLFTIKEADHTEEGIRKALEAHPEVQYVSFVGMDMGGHDTDEKIPVVLFLDQLDHFLTKGVQTDGSSVALPLIAELNDAKVDMIPDLHCHWYVDHNFGNVDYATGLPVGTLRIPSYLVHDDHFQCGSRRVLRDAVDFFKQSLWEELGTHPETFRYIEGADSADDIEEILLTAATELEFWVKTPDDKGDPEQLFTAQVLKEQYWKRTYGEVRTALEDTLALLDRYGFQVEMGHKELGGVKARMGKSGHYDHIMEQLEIDWRFADPMQAADNENQVKYIVRDIFTLHGLVVTFMAKPFPGVAGSGEHTHLGLSARLKNGRITNLFSAGDGKNFLSPVGYAALMGVLKNYEVINPFVSATNDAMERLKPGFEAPVCIVTSLGQAVDQPSRNRTVLIGLVRDTHNPLACHFEIRSPNPKSNTYLVLAASYLAVLDGIRQVLASGKTAEELEASLSKSYGEEDFYLEKNREYRSEKNVFDDYSPAERQKRFGRAPRTVWENIQALRLFPEKKKILQQGGVMSDRILASYEEQVLSAWKTELHDRIIPDNMNILRSIEREGNEEESSDLDEERWQEIEALRREIGKSRIGHPSLLERVKQALDAGQYDQASDRQVEMQEKMKKLDILYNTYKKNIL